ncbi:MAG TPA: hypothetical protein VF820_01865 [Patescibacteria group bacterium]
MARVERVVTPNIEQARQGITAEIPLTAEFTYIMRKDTAYAMDPIAEKLAAQSGVDSIAARDTLRASYERFFGRLTGALLSAYGSKYEGDIEIHVFEPGGLEQGIDQIAAGRPIVTLDPLSPGEHGQYHHLQISRSYRVGGQHIIREGARPGAAHTVEETATQIAEELHGLPAVLTDDDIFSGGSTKRAYIVLQKAGVNVATIAAGIQVGEAAVLQDLPAELKPAVRYSWGKEGDIFDHADLGDPRDFLVGASGLVVEIPGADRRGGDRAKGRAPYVLPFVSSSARLGIPQEREREFSLQVLQLNLQFFQEVEAQLGHPILLNQMDPHFAILMTEYYGLPPETPMTEVIKWSVDNFDQIWNKTTVDAAEAYQDLN